MFSQREPLQADLCVFLTSSHHFEHFLTFWHKKTFQAHFVLSLPQAWNQAFFFFFWSIISRNQEQGARYAHCLWRVIASRPSQQTARKYTHLCVYISIYFYTKDPELMPKLPSPF